jgi:hypothetical protein
MVQLEGETESEPAGVTGAVQLLPSHVDGEKQLHCDGLSAPFEHKDDVTACDMVCDPVPPAPVQVKVKTWVPMTAGAGEPEPFK